MLVDISPEGSSPSVSSSSASLSDVGATSDDAMEGSLGLKQKSKGDVGEGRRDQGGVAACWRQARAVLREGSWLPGGRWVCGRHHPRVIARCSTPGADRVRIVPVSGAPAL
eukprot:751648-Hanusia_phi.AAC.3